MATLYAPPQRATLTASGSDVTAASFFSYAGEPQRSVLTVTGNGFSSIGVTSILAAIPQLALLTITGNGVNTSSFMTYAAPPQRAVLYLTQLLPSVGSAVRKARVFVSAVQRAAHW